MLASIEEGALRRGGRTAGLTATEERFAIALLRGGLEDGLVTFRDARRRVYGVRADCEDSRLAAQIVRLRPKFESVGLSIVTVWGKGWRVVETR